MEKFNAACIMLDLIMCSSMLHCKKFLDLSKLLSNKVVSFYIGCIELQLNRYEDIKKLNIRKSYQN